MIYLVTGGAGFIGSNTVARLLELGERVRVLDNFATGKRHHLFPLHERVELIEGDIRYLNVVQEAVKGVDYVIHLAALPSVPRSIRTPIESNDVNVTGTLNVLIAARDAGVKRVVYGASSSAYGNTEVLPKVESMAALPLSPYAVNKFAGELYCRVFHQVYNLETVSLRYFNVFGPRQDPMSQYSAVIPKFIGAFLAGKRPVIYGDGEQSRDFAYVENVVSANLLACTAKDASGETINIACGERVTLNELARSIGRLVGTSLEPIYETTRTGDVKHSLADISKAAHLLGYEPKVRLEEGLRRTLEWLRIHSA
jgi:nucleoside-diphosphate-sugar epimerase